jgi:glycerophosphoryl diester phosphodiesterase
MLPMKIIGHRGAMGYEPENTIRSIKKAMELGADMVEFDVQKIKTGQIVLIHDSTVNRTTNGRGAVKNYAFADLRKLDAGKGEPVPTLQETLDAVNKKIAVNIELKGRGTAEPVAEIISQYIKEKGWRKEDFLVSSYMPKEIEQFNKIMPDIKIARLFAYFYVSQRATSKYLSVGTATKISFWRRLFTKRMVAKNARAQGYSFTMGTANSQRAVRAAKRLGADAVFTNFPDRARAALNSNEFVV